MNTFQPTIYLIPRWAGTIHSDWYDWLVLQVKNKYKIEIQRLEMPDWNKASIEESVQFLNKNIKELNSNTYFIGHSVGCQAILRFLDKQLALNNKLNIGGFLFVAGWFDVEKPWIMLKPWLNTASLNLPLISKITDFKKVILSDNDPFTPRYDQNKTLWNKQLNADVTIYNNRLHFNMSIEEDVLYEVEQMILFSNKNTISTFKISSTFIL